MGRVPGRRPRTSRRRPTIRLNVYARLELRLKAVWGLLRQTSVDWNRHEATRLGASLAFYTVLSLAPLVILAIALASLFVGADAAQRQVLLQLDDLLGSAGAT